MIPVVITTAGKGIPVNAVLAPGAGIPAIIAANGQGLPIVISTKGIPMRISGYTP